MRGLVATLFSLLSFQATAWADPVPLGSWSGTCHATGGPGLVQTGPIPGRGTVLVRLRLSHASTLAQFGAGLPPAGPGTIGHGTDLALAGADTVWAPAAVPLDGSVLWGAVLSFGAPGPGTPCDPAVDWNVAVFAAPRAPTSYAGVLTPGSRIGNGGGSVLPFAASSATDYAATVSVARGAVSLGWAPGRPPIVVRAAETRVLNLGPSGPEVLTLPLTVDALGAEQAVWTLDIVPAAPPTVTPKWVPTLIRPGHGTARLDLAVHDGPVVLTGTIRVRSATCRTMLEGVCRQYAAESRVGGPLILDPTPGFDGIFPRTWDGFCGEDEDGRPDPCPPGRYEAEVTYTYLGAGEKVTTAAAPISVADVTAPTVRLASPRRLRPRQRVVVKVADDAALRAVRMRVDGHLRGRFAHGRIAYRPRRGWSAGGHRLAVTATDKAGNRSTLRRRFIVRRSPRARTR
jgi:hypothetical protein